MKGYVDDGRLVDTIIHYFMVIVFQSIPVSVLPIACVLRH